MTMTAISKGYRRIIKLLSEYCNRQENNTMSKTTWSNEYETANTDRQNNELLGE